MFETWQFHMDYDGQRKSERIYQVIIVTAAVIGWIYGYIVQQFSHAVFILAGGLVLALVVCLPPWPCFHSKPLKWQKTRQQVTGTPGKESVSPHQKSKKKKQ